MAPFKGTNPYYAEKIKQEKVMIESAIKILVCSGILYLYSFPEEHEHSYMLHIRPLWAMSIGYFLNNFIRAFKHYRELVKLLAPR